MYAIRNTFAVPTADINEKINRIVTFDDTINAKGAFKMNNKDNKGKEVSDGIQCYIVQPASMEDRSDLFYFDGCIDTPANTVILAVNTKFSLFFFFFWNNSTHYRNNII